MHADQKACRTLWHGSDESLSLLSSDDVFERVFVKKGTTVTAIWAQAEHLLVVYKFVQAYGGHLNLAGYSVA